MRKLIAVGLMLSLITLALWWRLSFRINPAPRQQVSEAPASVKAEEGAQQRDFPHIEENGLQKDLSTTDTNSTFQRVLHGDISALSLSPETIPAYLESNGFNAQSLLAAFQTGGNREHLLAAARNFPHDPQVQLAVLMHDALPEERTEWVARLKRDASENSLPNYIAAREAFKSGQPEAALRELAEAGTKSRFHDYTVESMQAMEELYLADGRSAAEAKVAGMSSVLMPHLNELRNLAKDMVGMHQQYSSTQDAVGADLMAAEVTFLGRRLNRNDSPSLLSQVVGTVIESSILKQYSSDAEPAFLAMRADERLVQLQEQRQTAKATSRFLEQWLTTANERDVMKFFDRVKIFGEPRALDWLKTRTPPN